MSPEMAEQVLAALAAESRLSGIHLAGGEATLHLDRLEEVIRMAVAAGVPVDYLETNGWWGRNLDESRRRMQRLADAGLPAVLISVSLFHNEFIPFHRVRTCVEAARDVFGQSGVLIYMPHIYELLGRLPDDRPLQLEELCQLIGMTPDDPRIPASYGVIPGGRACSALRGCYSAEPAESFRGQSCCRELMSTSHFHVDLYGNLFTGLCAGLVAATVADLHPVVEPGQHPILTTLCHDGPLVLMGIAIDRHRFAPRADGYVSKCDLCLDVRTCLWQSGEYGELQPAGFYAEPLS
jgi:hypothetical protein